MSNLVPRKPAVPIPAPDSLNAEVARAEQIGVVTGARIHAGSFATSVALQNAAMLSRAANEAFKVSPMGEHVYQAILDAYGTFAVAEIQGLSARGRS